MASISFDKINEELDSIVSDFENLLNTGKNDEAEQLISEIMKTFEGNFDIELSDGSTEYDNVFHEVYSKIKEKLEAKAQEKGVSLEDLTKTPEYTALWATFESCGETFLKTADVRKALLEKDPEQTEYINALQEYIDNTNVELKEKQTNKEKSDFMEDVLLSDTSVSTKENRTDYIDQLNKVISNIENIKKYSVDPRYTDRIKDWKKEIEQSVDDLKSKGFNTSTIDDITEDSKISSGDSKTAVQDVIDSQYEAIRTQLIECQNGKFEFEDSDGNKTNLKDDDIIVNLPSDIATIDIKTPAGKAQIDNILKQIKDRADYISNELNVLNSKRDTFKKQMDIIELENEVISRNPDDRQLYLDALENPENATKKQEIEQEKAEREEDARAKSGIDSKLSRQYAKTYKEMWKKFEQNRHMTETPEQGSVEIFNVETGLFERNDYEFNYEHIDDYDGKEKDMQFMQIDSWESRAKKLGQYEEIGIAAYYDDEYKRTIESERNQMRADGKTEEEIKERMSELVKELDAKYEVLHKRDADYVQNYNSSHFAAKDTVAILKTGGSAMMVKNKEKGEITARDRIKAFFKYTNFKPKADGKRHVIRTAVSNLAGLASLPIRIVETGWGLGLAGARYLGAKVTGTYGMPTPYKVGAGARKEARQEYYMQNGSTAFGAWFKSWFNLKVEDNGEKVSLNEKLLRDRIREVNTSIEDKYIRFAKAQLFEEQKKARNNQTIRNVAYRNVAKSQEVYGDVHRAATIKTHDISSDAFKQKTRSEAIRRSALLYGKSDPAEIQKVMSESFVEGGKARINNKFTPKQGTAPAAYGTVQDVSNAYDFNGTQGETLWTNYVSRQNIKRGKTKTIDRALKILGATTIVGAKYVLSNSPIFKNSDNIQANGAQQQSGSQQIYGPEQPKTTDQTIYGVRDVYGKVTETKTVQMDYAHAKVGDCVRGDNAYWSSDLGAHTAHQPGVFDANDTVVQGVNFRFTDPTTGDTISYSIGDMQIKAYIDSHPNCSEFASAYQDLNITPDTPISKLADLLPDDIKQKYMQALSNSSNKLQFSNDTMQLAYGKGTSMGKGWSAANVPLDSVREVTTTVTKKVGEELYPINSNATVTTSIPTTTPITTPVQSVTSSKGESVINWIKHIPSSIKAVVKGEKIVLTGAASMIAQIYQQARFPFFSKGKKSTIDVDLNGKPKNNGKEISFTKAENSYDER